MNDNVELENAIEKVLCNLHDALASIEQGCAAPALSLAKAYASLLMIRHALSDQKMDFPFARAA